ncbi:MAG: ParB/RepB/Spo0J family partition protein [Acidobacteriota bacterium]
MPAAKGAPKKRRKNVLSPASFKPSDLIVEPPAEIAALEASVASDGGVVLGRYREPYGGRFLLLVGLPIDKVDRTPYQRDTSDTHVGRLGAVISKVGRFLDPIIVTRNDDGTYWTPNGGHRLEAMQELHAKAVTALLVPEAEVATKILALNTEKAHNLREKSLEVIRMARALAGVDKRKESDYALEFEEAPFLTLGCCYERNGRFSGGAYHSLLKRTDGFLEKPLAQALEIRAGRAEMVMEVDGLVTAAIAKLKERGSPRPTCARSSWPGATPCVSRSARRLSSTRRGPRRSISRAASMPARSNRRTWRVRAVPLPPRNRDPGCSAYDGIAVTSAVRASPSIS